MTALWGLLAAYIACGVIFIAIAIPLVQRRIPPNPWYGFRVERTLNDPDVWYPANAYAGRLLIAAGIWTILAAIVTAFVLAQREPPNIGVYVALCTAALLSGLAVAVILSFRYLRTLS